MMSRPHSSAALRSHHCPNNQMLRAGGQSQDSEQGTEGWRMEQGDSESFQHSQAKGAGPTKAEKQGQVEFVVQQACCYPQGRQMGPVVLGQPRKSGPGHLCGPFWATTPSDISQF